MTLNATNFRDAVVVKESDAERLGWGATAVRLIADSSSSGGSMNVVRVSLGKNTEGAKPHLHRGEAELFYVLDGELQVLTGERVITASAGDVVIVPPQQAHAFGSASRAGADLLIVIAPGIERFDYFRLLERVAKGESSKDELLAAQDRFDNHFLDSPAWNARVK